MYSPVVLAWKYLKYWLTAKNGKGHGIHSPFVYELVTNVLNDRGNYYCYEPVEALRRNMLARTDAVQVADLGAGSRKGTLSERKVADIARHALKPVKYGQLLFRLANYFKYKHIVELGTSLGITTCYLACSNHAAKVYTLEGVTGIAAIARQNFQHLGLNNVDLVEGNFDATLQHVLNKAGRLDMAYIDGNHRLEPTLRYFQQMKPFLHSKSMVVFDDIHWSAEMEQAWEKVQADPQVSLTIDLFFIGLVFFDTAFKAKQKVSIRF